MKFMREGPQLGVDAYGVRGCARSCRGASPRRDTRLHTTAKALADAFHMLNYIVYLRQGPFILNTRCL